MWLLRGRQGHSMIRRWQCTISRSRALSSSSTTTVCSGSTAILRPLSLYSTSTLQQNYNDVPSLQHVITRSNLIKQSHIYPRNYQRHISNNFIYNCNNANNQLRWFTSSGRHKHHGGRGRGSHQSTNRIPMMKEFNTLDEAIEVYYDNLEIVTPRNLSSFWAVVPRLLRYQHDGVNNLVPQLEAIFLKTADQIHSYGPQDLAATTLGFAKIIQTLQTNKRRFVKGSYEGYLHGILIRQRDAVFSFLARTAVNKLNQFEPRHLKDLAYTYALLEYDVPKQLDDGSTLFDHIAKESIPLLGKFKPQHISNIVWAFEKVKSPQPKLFKKVGDYIVTLNHLNDFAPQALSNILLAYAKAGVSHPDLFKRIGDHIVTLEHLNDFKPQNLSNLVWSFEKEKVSHPDLFYKVGEHIVSLDHLNDFVPQNLANILYAYAKAEISHPDLFNKVADHIVSLDNLDGYNEQNISNLAWAYNKAGVIRQDLNDKFIGAAVGRKKEFSHWHLDNLYRWASEEEGIEDQNDDEQNEEGEDENDSVTVVDDDDNADSKDEVLVEDDTTSSIPEDLSLLTVVQLKDRLRNLGLPVSGRKQVLIDRLNDHIQSK